MKFYKNLFIMLFVLICLTSYYLYIENPNIYTNIWNNWKENSIKQEQNIEQEHQHEHEHSEPVSVFDRTKAVEFIITNKTSNFKLQKQNNVWEISEGDVKQEELDIIVQYLLNLASLNLVETTPTNWEKYGLENPTTNVMAVIEDGTNVQYYLGIQNDNGEYYVRVRDANKVFKISKETGNEFLREITPKNVFEFKAENIVRYTVNVVNGSGRNRFVKEAEKWNRISTDETFIPLEKQKEFTDKIQTFATLKRIQYIGINLTYEQLQTYGLTNPEYIIAFNGNGIPQTTMDIGMALNGQVYVELNNEVFTIDEKTLKILLEIEY